jgi:hypothetical protein
VPFHLLPEIAFRPEEQVSTPAALIPVTYPGDANTETSRIVRIEPFKRNVLITQHRPQMADFHEYKWLLKHGSTEFWYDKPQRAFFRQTNAIEGSSFELPDLPPLSEARPVSLETPTVWASRVFTTPTDDEVYGRTTSQIIDGGNTAACHKCSKKNSEVPDYTPLLYCLVLTTFQASNPFIHGAHFNGRQIYKIIKCGSREAATTEAFNAAGVNGWNVAFSCIMRLGEDFEERNGIASPVKELWMLGKEEKDKSVVRVFY